MDERDLGEIPIPLLSPILSAGTAPIHTASVLSLSPHKHTHSHTHTHTHCHFHFSHLFDFLTFSQNILNGLCAYWSHVIETCEADVSIGDHVSLSVVSLSCSLFHTHTRHTHTYTHTHAHTYTRTSHFLSFTNEWIHFLSFLSFFTLLCTEGCKSGSFSDSLSSCG